MTPSLELALAFHQAVLEDHDAVSATITRLRELTQDGDHAYYIDFACFMADLPLPPRAHHPQWLDGEQATRGSVHGSVRSSV
ncbi:hypothetical protein [Streptomyces sp. NBC_00268]|jgi:hypothetical protein|uniref:hypothetical protein n=1 Tax=Streptomyces sp. NBC_00268 TaxID=2975695 RepID=UPI002253FAE3|nr:hypothetical protein [Streptomyces sp. NBC_00268]MCX5190632.1 hypothetical protein [Streptomyces sp. NBC_00268]